MQGEKDFDFDAFKDNGPAISQNTLFLGSSNCFRESSSTLNKNITHITGIGNCKNDTLYDYSNGKQFFDNSIINNINRGLTMTSLAPNNNDRILTNTSIDNQANTSHINPIDQSQNNNLFIEGSSNKDIAIQNKTINDIASQLNENVNKPNMKNNIPKPKEKEKEKDKEITFENAKYIKPPVNNNRRRSARKFIEDSEKEGTNFIVLNKKEEPPKTVNVGNNAQSGNTGNKFSFGNKEFAQKATKQEFQSRRMKAIHDGNNGDVKVNPAIHLSKLLEGDETFGNSPKITNKKIPSGNGILFGMESRRVKKK